MNVCVHVCKRLCVAVNVRSLELSARKLLSVFRCTEFVCDFIVCTCIVHAYV